MNDATVSKVFKLYAKLQIDGKVNKEDSKLYFVDDEARGLLTEFVQEVDCGLIQDDKYLYMVPLTTKSNYHMSNDRIKRDYFPSRALNMDIYLMYVAIIVFIGEFYDSYQRSKPTRDFLKAEDWIISLDDRIQTLKRFSDDELKEKEEQYEYHWLDIIKNWDAMDMIKEGIRRHTSRTVSRMSFIKIVANFMYKQDLLIEIGEEEYQISRKAMAIAENYYMDYEYNRGVLEFIYQFEKEAD